MTIGTLDFTLISATISYDAGFDFEPTDTYATVKCSKEQHSTKAARDQGRLPAWNETFTFNLQEEDLSKDIIVQIFGVKPELDELLGSIRIPLSKAIEKEETTLLSLTRPNQGECGQLKAAWRFMPTLKETLRAPEPHREMPGMQGFGSSYSPYPPPTFDSSDPFNSNYGSVFYPHLHSENTKPGGDKNFDDAINAMSRLNVNSEKFDRNAMPSAPPLSNVLGKSEVEYTARGEQETHSSQGGEHPFHSYGAVPFESYPPGGVGHSPSLHTGPVGSEALGYSGYPSVDSMPPAQGKYNIEKQSMYNSSPYPPSGDYNYPPPSNPVPAYPPTTDTYPSYPGYPPVPSSSDHSYRPEDNKGENSVRGSGETKDKGKGHDSHVPYSYPPPEYSMHGGYPPAAYPAPSGETKDKGKGHDSHVPYSYPPPEYSMHGGYPPPAYPAPHGYGYPPPYGQPPAGYPPAGYPPAPAYPPAPHGYPPAPHGYPPAPAYYSAPAYPPYGYPPPAHGAHQHTPYPMAHGHDGMGYAAGAYAGHSSHGHQKHHKHQKHYKYEHGHYQPHYKVHGHHQKHKKHHYFGKGLKFKF